jgi:hypothetical protein
MNILLITNCLTRNQTMSYSSLLRLYHKKECIHQSLIFFQEVPSFLEDMAKRWEAHQRKKEEERENLSVTMQFHHISLQLCIQYNYVILFISRLFACKYRLLGTSLVRTKH